MFYIIRCIIWLEAGFLYYFQSDRNLANSDECINAIERDIWNVQEILKNTKSIKSNPYEVNIC